MEYHADLLAELQKLPAGQLREALAVDYHLAAGRAFEEVYAAHQGALSCAAETDDAEYLAVLNCEVYAVKRDNLFLRCFIDLAEILQFYHINTPKIKQTRKLVAFRPVVNTFSASDRQVYEASEQFLAHIIMHMLIMRIIPIIMLSKRTLNMCCSLLLSRMA